jgi:preprotein translocase SecE subunit
MNTFIQYLKDTQAELRHVAWPTQAQTIVFTALVVLVSVFISLYLGFFDYVFTSSLKRVVNARTGNTPSSPIEISTSSPATSTPVNSAPLKFTPTGN